MACYVFLTCFSKEAAAPLFGSLVADGYPISPLKAVLDGSIVHHTVTASENSLAVLITFEIRPALVAKGTKTVPFNAHSMSNLITQKCKELSISTLSVVIYDVEIHSLTWVTGNTQKPAAPTPAAQKKEQPEPPKNPI